MRKFKTILILLIVNCSTYAQDVIDFYYKRDYKRILEMTKLDTSSIFYQNLFKRFLVILLE